MHDYVCVECKQACVSREMQCPTVVAYRSTVPMEHKNLAPTTKGRVSHMHLPQLVPCISHGGRGLTALPPVNSEQQQPPTIPDQRTSACELRRRPPRGLRLSFAR